MTPNDLFALALVTEPEKTAAPAPGALRRPAPSIGRRGSPAPGAEWLRSPAAVPQEQQTSERMLWELLNRGIPAGSKGEEPEKMAAPLHPALMGALVGGAGGYATGTVLGKKDPRDLAMLGALGGAGFGAHQVAGATAKATKARELLSRAAAPAAAASGATAPEVADALATARAAQAGPVKSASGSTKLALDLSHPVLGPKLRRELVEKAAETRFSDIAIPALTTVAGGLLGGPFGAAAGLAGGYALTRSGNQPAAPKPVESPKPVNMAGESGSGAKVTSVAQAGGKMQGLKNLVGFGQ